MRSQHAPSTLAAVISILVLLGAIVFTAYMLAPVAAFWWFKAVR